MKRARPIDSILVAAVVAGLVLGVVGTAQASGVGGYFEYGNVDGQVDGDGGGDVDFDADQYGVGVVFDSNLAANKLFNYRGSFGYRRSEHTFKNLPAPFPAEIELDAAGFEMNHLLGFGVFRTSRVRVFIGPAIRFGFDVFDTPSNTDLVAVDLGLGPEVGLNIHLAKHLTVSPWVAYQYHYTVHAVEIDGVGDDAFDGDQHVVKAGLSIFFRSGDDQFRRSRQRYGERRRSDRSRNRSTEF